jgi:hypothetical protein
MVLIDISSPDLLHSLQLRLQWPEVDAHEAALRTVQIDNRGDRRCEQQAENERQDHLRPERPGEIHAQQSRRTEVHHEDKVEHRCWQVISQ